MANQILYGEERMAVKGEGRQFVHTSIGVWDGGSGGQLTPNIRADTTFVRAKDTFV